MTYFVSVVLLKLLVSMKQGDDHFLLNLTHLSDLDLIPSFLLGSWRNLRLGDKQHLHDLDLMRCVSPPEVNLIGRKCHVMTAMK